MGAGEWIGLIAAVLAVVALPTAFQMFYGRPKIEFVFSTHNTGDTTLLLVHLYNTLVTNPLLQRIGVRREEAHFSVVITVTDSVGNQILKYPEPPFSSGDVFRPNQFHLHAGGSPVTLELLGANGQHARIYYEKRAESFTEFDSGIYQVHLDAHAGELIFFDDRAFVVTQNSLHSYWADV